MQAMRKAQVSRELGVSKARISQYVAQGMPVRPDGKIDIEAARRWVSANVDPTRRVMQNAAKDRRNRPGRAYDPKKGAPSGYTVLDEMENVVDRAIVTAGLSILYQQRGDIACMAIEAGASCKVAYATANFAFALMMERLLKFWRDCGIEYFQNTDADFLEIDSLVEADWEKLAAKTGETFDEKAWIEYQTSLEMSGMARMAST